MCDRVLEKATPPYLVLQSGPCEPFVENNENAKVRFEPLVAFTELRSSIVLKTLKREASDMPVTQFCWRCQMEVPMLTDAERNVVWTALANKTVSSSERTAKFLAEYERLTGFKETNPNAVHHHVASQYGPPCRECGKPFRTPKASFCAACGVSRTEVE
jgi:hypothetical protein